MKCICLLILNFIPLSAKNTLPVIVKTPSVVEIKPTNKEFERFSNKMSLRESGNNPDTVNVQGYIGLYQFGKSALDIIGYGYVSIDSFKINPTIFPKHIQKIAFKKLIKLNEMLLKDYIKRYNGRFVNGIKITKSGILGAAHLAGHGGVKKYFDKGYVSKDVFGTTIECYLKEFSGYYF